MLDLEPIKERESKATKGPWEARDDTGNSQWNTWGVWTKNAANLVDGARALWIFLVDRMGYQKDDAEFIAHSRQDIPNLIAEAERLRTALRACQSHAGHPDAAEGCRLVIAAADAALNGKEEESDATT